MGKTPLASLQRGAPWAHLAQRPGRMLRHPEMPTRLQRRTGRSGLRLAPGPGPSSMAQQR
eukprot:7486310-Lingulodinium_polyedra.AAC.1